MKKINFLSKVITLILFSSILVSSLSFRKDWSFHTRKYEINLRNLKENTPLVIVISIFYSTCFVSFFFFLFYFLKITNEICRNESLQPNFNTFFYFVLNGLLILNVLCLFFGNVLGIEYQLIGVSLIYVIWSIKFLVKCRKNPENFCSDICSGGYLKDLALFPLEFVNEFCYKDDRCCDKEVKSKIHLLCCPYSFIFCCGTLIGYYLFLIVFIFFWSLINILKCCSYICDDCPDCCNCDCCKSCHCCCTCCCKKKNQNTTHDNEDDICVARPRDDAIYLEATVHYEIEINTKTNDD